MIWISSACAVGTRLAARLVDRTGVLLTAPRTRIHEARSAVVALLGYDPGDNLDVRLDDFVPTSADSQRDCISEIWHLSYIVAGAYADLLAGFARETGAVYRRFDLDQVAETPGEVVPGAFSAVMQALDATLAEVRSRDPGYFEQRALRTTLPADLTFLDAGSAASEILSAASGPPGPCRISAAKTRPSFLSDAISEAYEVELVVGEVPSALAAVDCLFESRLGNMTAGGSTEPIHWASAVGSSELARLVSAWHRHHAASSRAEQARLADFSTAAIVGSPEGEGPAFEVFGRSGPQIVIVNAIAQDLKYWVRLVDRLAQDHRVVTWTQRALRKDGELATVKDHLRDLESVVSAVAEGRVHLVGWCTGPKLCTRYCLAHPSRIASLVFVAGSYRPFAEANLDTSYETKLEMVFKLLDRSPNAAAIVRTTLLAAMSEGPLNEAQVPDLGAEVLARTDPALIPSVAAPYLTDDSTLQYAKQIRDFWGHSIEPDVGGIHAPALVIGAGLDRIASARRGQRVAEAMPNARYVELLGATHYCMYDRPDEVASLIRGFIDEQDTCHSYSYSLESVHD